MAIEFAYLAFGYENVLIQNLGVAVLLPVNITRNQCSLTLDLGYILRFPEIALHLLIAKTLYLSILGFQLRHIVSLSLQVPENNFVLIFHVNDIFLL